MEAGKRITLTEAMEIFSEHLDAIAEDLASNILFDLSQMTRYPATDDPIKQWIYDELTSMERDQIVTKRTKVINRIKSRNQPVTYDRITDADIERAKEVPISELYDGRLFKDSAGLCPFHNERTPSFHIFKDNRFKCFGCGEHGSAIDFYMKQNNVDFISAVKQLSKM